MSPPREKEVKIKEEIKEEEPTTPNSREEKKKQHVKRSMSVVQGKTAGSLLARAVTTRRATTPSARTEEKRLRAHNGEPTPKDNSKMTREERKMEAIMKAFERLEKNEQRKQQQHTPSTPTEKRPREPSQRKISETSPKSPRKQSLNRRESRMSKVSLRSRGRSNLNQQRNRSKIKSKAKTRRSRSPRFTASTGEESSDDEVMSPRKPPVQRRRRIQQNKKRPPTPPSPDKDDEEDEEEIEEEEESNSPLRNVKMGETPPLSNTCLLVAAAVGPLAPGFKFPKTKKNMLNSWLVGEGGSTPPLQEETPDQSTETNDQPEQNSDSQDNVQTSSADHCTAKKRWLRQAISEDSDSPRLDGGSGSPVEMAAPLKKRRVARESVSSDTAFTPPTTPSTEQLTQIYEDDENSAGLSPARESEANQVNTASDQQQIPSDTQLQPENCGSSTPKLFESPRSDDSKPLSPETAVVPKSVEVSSKDESSELPPMQVAEDPESQLAAMEEEISSPVKSEPSVKPVSDMSKEHADAVELLKELTTDEPQRDTVNEAVNETEHGDEQVDSPVKHSAEEKMEEKESAKIKRKLSISEYRERVKSNPPKQKKWSDDESAIDKKLNNSNDSDSDESSSEINSLLAKIDAANIDFGVTSFKKGTGSFSAEPTLVEKQREALTDRLKREFGLFLSDDEEKTIANAANQIQNNSDGKAGDAGSASISPNSSRLVRDRRTRRPPPPPPSGPPPPPVLGPPPPPTTLPQVLPTSQRLPAVIPTMPPVLTPQPPPGLVGQTGGPAWGFYPPNGSGLPPPPPLPPQHRYHMRH